MNRLITILFATASFSVSAQVMLTLDQAISAALEHNHDLFIAGLDAEKASNSATYGNAGMLPSVTAAAGSNYSNQNSNLEFATGQTQDVKGAQSLSQNASLGLSQVLFSGGRMQRSYALLKSTERAANVVQRQAMENTIAQVWSQYMALSLLQRSVSTASENMMISNERFTKAQLTNELGGSNTTDLLSARVDLNRDKVSLMNIETQLESARNTFATFIGWDNSDYAVGDGANLTVLSGFDVKQVMTKMLANNAVLELAKISAETAELQEKMQQATLFPTISAQVSYGVNQSQAEAGFLSASQQTGLNAGMNFNYNLFSGFQSQTQRQNTQIETLKAERRLDQVRESTENAVKNAIRMFDNATSVARLESENAEVSRQRFQKMDELFELGKASSLELREAQLAWLAAENGKSSAQFQAVNAQIALFQLMGSITSDGAVSVGAND